MKLISVLAAGVTFVAAYCNDNELYICPVGKNKADRVHFEGGVENEYMVEDVSRNYKIQCPKDSYIALYDGCDSDMVSRRTNESWCEDWLQYNLNEKANLFEYTVPRADATHYYRKKCDGKRSCKVQYKKDTKKMGAPKVSEVEIYLSWDCAYNFRDYSKKDIKQQRKAAVRANTNEAMNTFWTWYDGI